LNKLVIKINQDTNFSEVSIKIENFVSVNSKTQDNAQALKIFNDSIGDLISQGKNSFTSGSNLNFERTITHNELEILIKGNFSQKSSILNFFKNLFSN